MWESKSFKINVGCLDLAVEDKAVISPPRNGRSTAKYARTKISIKTGQRLKNWIECNILFVQCEYSVIEQEVQAQDGGAISTGAVRQRRTVPLLCAL